MNTETHYDTYPLPLDDPIGGVPTDLHQSLPMTNTDTQFLYPTGPSHWDQMDIQDHHNAHVAPYTYNDTQHYYYPHHTAQVGYAPGDQHWGCDTQGFNYPAYQSGNTFHQAGLGTFYSHSEYRISKPTASTSSNLDPNNYPLANHPHPFGAGQYAGDTTAPIEPHWQHTVDPRELSFGQTHHQPFSAPPYPSWMPYSPTEPQCCLDERHVNGQQENGLYDGSQSTSDDEFASIMDFHESSALTQSTPQVNPDVADEPEPGVSFDPVVEEFETAVTKTGPPRPPLFVWTQSLRLLRTKTKTKKAKKPGKSGKKGKKGKTSKLSLLSKPNKRTSMSAKQKGLIFGIFSSIIG